MRSIPAWAGKPQRGAAHRRELRVYPRVGGETMTSAANSTARPGLSPRGRGNLSTVAQRLNDIRSIPAWAGKPQLSQIALPRQRVYPRVGGETCGKQPVRLANPGLSPRGRGKPSGATRKLGRAGVYPRVGGETSDWRSESTNFQGLSPRGRGNPVHPAGPVG